MHRRAAHLEKQPLNARTYMLFAASLEKELNGDWWTPGSGNMTQELIRVSNLCCLGRSDCWCHEDPAALTYDFLSMVP